MIRALYAALAWLAQPFLRRKLQRRGRTEPGYLQAIDERFGYYSQPAQCASGDLVWVHAVSLGETRAAAVLVAALRLQLPGMRLLLTHGTATGRAEGAALLQGGDIQVWQPWDAAPAVRRFLQHFRPRIGILMETEVWPNMAHACRSRALPLVLANARLSDKSLQQALRLRWLSAPAYAALAAVWAQTAADAARLRQLGAPVQGVFGNLKFDATPEPAQLAQARVWRETAPRRPIVLLASSREGEEAALLRLLQADARSRVDPQASAAQPGSAHPAGTGRRSGPDASDGPMGAPAAATPSNLAQVQWLIVPRHPQRFDVVAALIGQHGFTASRRSAWTDLPRNGAAAPGSAGAAAPAGAPLGDTPAGADALRVAPGPVPAGAIGPEPWDSIWLGDSMGEMALYYGLADVALLGGSFEPLGGQNLIEAAACGCPVVMGAHTFNFAEAAELARAAGAALRVQSLAQAAALAAELATDATRCAAMGRTASAFAAAHRGATEQTARAIAQLLALRP